MCGNAAFVCVALARKLLGAVYFSAIHRALLSRPGHANTLLLCVGSQDETPEVRAAKQEMSDALKTRRTELEDRLYDKVQELKKLCMQEAVLFTAAVALQSTSLRRRLAHTHEFLWFSTTILIHS